MRTPILRYLVDPDHRDESLAELLTTCTTLGIAEVMLFDGDYLGPEKFLSPARLAERCDHLAFCAERIRRAGITFHLNVFHTLGHIYVPQRELQFHGFLQQQRADGTAGTHPVFDPLCPRLATYLEALYRLYASLHPGRIFVDDDFNVGIGQCFAPQRVQRFAAGYGCAADPAVVQQLLQAGDGRAWQIMRQLITADLCALAVRIRLAVHSVNSQIQIGFMYPAQVYFDVERVAAAFAGTHRPFVRPQIPLYREECAISEYPERFWSLDRWRAALGERVELFPEAENFPYDPGIKSPAAAFAHFSYILASGEPAPALSLNANTIRTPACESRALVERFAQRREQSEALIALVQSGVTPLGAAVLDNPAAVSRPPNRRANLAPLFNRGIPLHCECDPARAVVFWGDSLAGLADGELQAVLRGGGFLDLAALSTLIDRGCTAQIGLSVAGRCALDEVMQICYPRLDHGFELWNFNYFVGRLGGTGHIPLRVTAENAVTRLSYLDDCQRETVPHLLTWTAPNGARFALLNAVTAVENDPAGSYRTALMSHWSPLHYAEAIEWVIGEALPARLIADGRFLLKAVAVRDSPTLLLACWNLSTDAAPRFSIELSPALSGHRWSTVEVDGSQRSIEVVARANTKTLCIEESTPTLGSRFFIGTR